MIVSSVTNNNNNNNDNRSPLSCAFEAIPMFRRLESIPDDINNGDGVTALGMASLALINLPEDCRDVIGAAKQVKSIFTKEKYVPNYDYKNFQHDFSFFRGTFLEKWLDKNANEGKKWAQWLDKNDITIADTSLGQKIIDKVGAQENKAVETAIKNSKGEAVLAFEYGGPKFAELTGRAMLRTTKLGVIALGILELPKILKAFSKGNNVADKTGNVAKQTVKSAVNVASVTAGIAYCGAIGSKYGKGFGSIVGMGIGAILGSQLSKTVQNVIS